MNQKIDWEKPIEAVSKTDGRVVPMVVSYVVNGCYFTESCPDPSESNRQWYRDGGNYCHKKLWYIRNVKETVMAKPSPKRETLELALSMIEKHRGMILPTGWSFKDTEATSPSLFHSGVVILAETLEKLWAADPSTRPVSENLLLARKVMADECNLLVNKKDYTSGKFDNTPTIKRVLSAIEAGRKAEREKLGKATGE